MADLAHERGADQPLRAAMLGGSRMWRGLPVHILPLVILLYTCLIFAPEAETVFSGVKLTAYRLIILVLILPAIVSFMRSGRRVLMPDIAIALGCAWMVLSFVILYSPAEGIVRSAGIVIDALGAYIIARASIRSLADLRRVLIVMAPGFFIAGAILAVESISHRIIYRTLFARIFGAGSVYVDGNVAGTLVYRENTRLGLLRGYSTFSHPILAGVTLASVLPLYWMSGIRSWPLWMGIAAGLLSFFSVSSISLLMLGLAIVMLLIDWARPVIPKLNWPFLTLAGGMVLVALHLSSEGGVLNLIARFTLNPHNGYVRIIQWESAFATLRDDPWFGIGYLRVPDLPSWLPPSIDAHFLVLALRTGWPTMIAFYFAMIWMMIALGLQSVRLPGAQRNLTVGLNMAVFLLLVASFTVTYFGETNVYFMAILGVGAALSQPVQVRAPNPAMRSVPMRAPLQARALDG
ncbi:MAG: hypothetical protein V2J51_17590 [Erythrobacter sp.]|jgi:hypothetical protein|nr:hypothetical protein [Erythrobacter sp.]